MARGILLRGKHGPARSASSPEADEQARQERRELDRSLMDAERVMMQTLQTSLSLIGFGFTINEVFNSGAIRGLGSGAPTSARLMGETLLVLGIMLLSFGILNQFRIRQRLLQGIQRKVIIGAAPGLRFRDAPSFMISAILLVVGLCAFVSGLFRRVL